MEKLLKLLLILLGIGLGLAAAQLGLALYRLNHQNTATWIPVAAYSGMGVLGGKIASDIEDTFQRVQDGLARIGSTYGLGNAPAGDTSSVSRTAVSASTSTLVARSSTFDMEVTTREGDKLKISIAQASANWSSTSASASGFGSS